MAIESIARSDWKKLPLGEAVLINPRVPLERGEVYPHIAMADVNPNWHNVSSPELRVYKGGGSKFRHGDTLMARITPCLENGKITSFDGGNDDAVGFGSTEFNVIRGRDQVTDNRYAYYLARSAELREHAVASMMGTSGRQRVPTQALADFVVEIPPLPEQRRIAHILGTLDDKIELNRRMNETLEEMARAVFKDWFVDFGPVWAKIDGRDPYLPDDIWQLFPDRMVESELGLVPEGWEVMRLGNCYNLTMGQSPPGNTYNERGEGISFFQGRTDFGFRYPANRRYCTAPTRFAEPDDTLVSVRAPVGDINMAWEKCCIGRGLAALRHKSGSRTFTYYSALAIQDRFRDYEHTGTVFGSINKKQFEALDVIEPSPETVDVFHRQLGSIDDEIRLTNIDSRNLATQRDTLLPSVFASSPPTS